MLFNSLAFALFFALFLPAFLLIAPGRRLTLIVVGSLLFYIYYKPGYFWVPLLLAGIAFWGTGWLMRGAEGGPRRWRLAGVIALLFLPLVFFKYLPFFLAILGLATLGRQLELPLGISFVTFTVTAYVVDVAKGRFPRERSLKKFLAHILFFPHLIAGPILRPSELLPQLGRGPALSSDHALIGCALFALGLLKKIAVADYVAPLVDRAYAPGAMPSQLEAWLALYGFSVQIYCDFSGYTDMALGLAAILGYRLPGNFASPYGAHSVVEFWRRWHITLSHWLRDYLYIPLGGNRVGFAAQLRNIMIVMVLGGLWHGANWTFVAWGALHGLGLVLVRCRERLGWRPMSEGPLRFLAVLVTFHFVAFAWVLFRAPDFATAKHVMAALLGRAAAAPPGLLAAAAGPIAVMALCLMLHPLDRHEVVVAAVRRAPLRWASLAIGLTSLTALAFAIQGTGSFIYFAF